jgi:hypothetical protein
MGDPTRTCNVSILLSVVFELLLLLLLLLLLMGLQIHQAKWTSNVDTSSLLSMLGDFCCEMFQLVLQFFCWITETRKKFFQLYPRTISNITFCEHCFAEPEHQDRCIFASEARDCTR